jgi:hypothetical protein
LPLAHHVNHLNASKCSSRTSEGLEAEHWPDTPLDPPVFLFDAVIQILALPDADRLQPAPRAILEAG